MPLVPPSSRPAFVDQLAVDLGYQSWNYPVSAPGSNTAPTQGTIYAEAIYIPPGTTVTGLVLTVSTAAAGNKPTAFVVGISTATLMLAQSGDLSGNAGVPFAAAGPTQLAFAAPYVAVDSPTGLYYMLFLQVGAYSVTQPTFGRASGITSAALSGKTLPYAVAGTAQAALPINGAAVALAANNLGYFVGAY